MSVLSEFLLRGKDTIRSIARFTVELLGAVIGVDEEPRHQQVKLVFIRNSMHAREHIRFAPVIAVHEVEEFPARHFDGGIARRGSTGIVLMDDTNGDWSDKASLSASSAEPSVLPSSTRSISKPEKV